jgi:2,3-bisphosphoglycerate-independent phosphoglycerate mutase
MGNSEVGHLTLGAGDVIRQDIVTINDAIENGQFFQNPTLLYTIEKAKQLKRPVHLFGLVSDGGVHSHINHLYALIEVCRRYSVKPLLHMFTDGRDTPPQSALSYLKELENTIHQAGGAIVSITGRYYAMDRDNRWERTELAWRAMMLGKGQTAISAESAIRAAYAAGDTDEFIRPILLPAFQAIEETDQLICFNFRKDRPRQLVAALGQRDFIGFDRGNAPLAEVTCMMPYNRAANLAYLFEPERPEVTLAQVISTMGLSQFHCAETEKYAHVTYFFNGGRAEPHSGEHQLLIPSPNVATYDQKPQMSAHEVADAVIKAISYGRYGFMIVNFANGDMVGHTAKRHAVLSAVKTLDEEVGRVLDAAETAGYSVILTADHGNCEELVDPLTGEPHTQHTTYPVPCMIMDEMNWQLSCNGGLANVAPTALELMGFQVPSAMKASSLLLRSSKREPDRHTPVILKGVA